MYFGRTVFGLGGETLSVAMSAMIAQWFTGKELALALGMNLALARVGSVINDFASQAIAEKAPIYWALWVGLLVCILSLLMSTWAFFIDKTAVKQLRKNRTKLRWQGLWPPALDRAQPSVGDQEEEVVRLLDANMSSPLLAADATPEVSSSRRSISINEDLSLPPPAPATGGTSRSKRTKRGADDTEISLAAGHREVPPSSTKAVGFEYSPAPGARRTSSAAVLVTANEDLAAHGRPLGGSRARSDTDTSVRTDEIVIDSLDDLDVNPEAEEVKLKAVFTFPLIFWILTGSCLTVYCTVLPFNNIASNFIQQKWDVSNEDANTIMTATYLVAGVLSPFMGWVIDRVGLRAVLNVVAALLIVGVHALLGFTELNPIFPLVVLGLCYSIYAAALWPSIALVIEPEKQGTAYGVVTAVQNAGLALSPVVIGALTPPACDNNYKCVELFFICLGAVGVLFGLWLNIEDRRRDVSVLNLNSKDAKECAAQLRNEANEQASLLQGDKMPRTSFGAVEDLRHRRASRASEAV